MGQYWRTADGKSILIQDMQLGHLVNVINWVSDNLSMYGHPVLNTMIEEAQTRQMTLFANGSPYPQFNGKRWVILDPNTGVGKIEKPPEDYIEAVKDNVSYQRMSKSTQEKRKNNT
jgi:hypothetical protein